VGHSYGGFLAPLVAAKAPERVSGMVLVDPNTLHYFDAHPEAAKFATWAGRAIKILGPLGLARLVAGGGISKMVPDALADRREEIIQIALTDNSLRALGQSSAGFPQTLATIRELPWPTDTPLVVISRGVADPGWDGDNREADWREGHRALVNSHPNARLLIADESTHQIPWMQPDVVAQAVTALKKDIADAE